MTLQHRTKRLHSAVVGRQKTWRIVIERDGETLDLTGMTLTVTAVKPDGTTFVVPDSALESPQVGSSRGALTVTAAYSVLDTEGDWGLDVFLGSSSTTVEPVDERLVFRAEAKETFA